MGSSAREGPSVSWMEDARNSKNEREESNESPTPASPRQLLAAQMALDRRKTLSGSASPPLRLHTGRSISPTSRGSPRTSDASDRMTSGSMSPRGGGGFAEMRNRKQSVLAGWRSDVAAVLQNRPAPSKKALADKRKKRELSRQMALDAVSVEQSSMWDDLNNCVSIFRSHLRLLFTSLVPGGFMSSAHFQRFAKQFRLISPSSSSRHRSVTTQDADLLFIKVVTEEKAKRNKEDPSKRDPTVKEGFLNFDSFCLVLVLLAQKTYPDLQIHTACEALLDTINLQHHIPNTAGHELDQLVDPSIIEIFTRHEIPLKAIYVFFADRSSGLRISRHNWTESWENLSMSLEDFRRLAQCFRIIPSLSFTEIRGIWLKMVNGSTHETLGYPQFLECLGRCALAVFGKPPHDTAYPTPYMKVETFFEIDLKNVKEVVYDFNQRDSSPMKDRLKVPWEMVTRVIESPRKLSKSPTSFERQLNRSVKGSPQKQRPVMSPKCHDAQLLSAKEREDAEVQRIVGAQIQLIQENPELDDKLHRIFIHYCSYGDSLNAALMGRAKFYKFVRDCQLIDGHSFEKPDMDIIFSQVVHSGIVKSDARDPRSQNHITYDQFLELLVVISRRKWEWSDLEEAPVWPRLDRLLSEHVIPLAQSTRRDPISEAMMMPEIIDLFVIYEEQLTNIFRVYAELGKQTPAGLKPSLTLNQITKLAKDFSLIPMLSEKEISTHFSASVLLRCEDGSHSPSKTAVSHSPSKTVSNNTLSLEYPQFLEFLARCAVHGCGRLPSWDGTPFTEEELLDALLDHMSLDDSKGLGLILQERSKGARSPHGSSTKALV